MNAEGIYTVLSEGIYTPRGIQGVFTLDDKGYLHRKVNAEGIYTGCEMPRVFTLDVKCQGYLHWIPQGYLHRSIEYHQGYLHWIPRG